MKPGHDGTSNLPDRMQCCICISCRRHARFAPKTSTLRGVYVSYVYGAQYCAILLNTFGGRHMFYEGNSLVEPKCHLPIRLLNLLLLNLLLLNLLLNLFRGPAFSKGESPSRD